MSKFKQMSVFANIVEAGSISAAADKLNVSKSVVSQHLKALELELGVTLLKRTTRRQALTPTGELFYIQCKELNNIATTAWDTVKTQQAEPTGNIKITAPNALMETLITPVIANLMTQYPKLTPELVSADQHIDFLDHNIDLAIRVGPSKDSTLKQKRIGSFTDRLCIKTGVIKNPKQLESEILNKTPYIANTWQGLNIDHTFKNKHGEPLHFSTQARCLANSFHSCLSLIKAGAGMGLVPDFYLNLVKPSLEVINPDYSLSSKSIYALTPYTRNMPISVKICIDEIIKHLNKLTT